jgi:hypothetical protein
MLMELREHGVERSGSTKKGKVFTQLRNNNFFKEDPLCIVFLGFTQNLSSASSNNGLDLLLKVEHEDGKISCTLVICC